MLEKLHVFHIRKSNSHIFVQLSAAHGRVGEAARETHAFGLEAALQRRHEPLLASSSVVSDSTLVRANCPQNQRMNFRHLALGYQYGVQ